MPFGILDDPYLEHVPGTAALVEVNGIGRSGLKHEGKNSNIILVPQPSNDPQDPLNWPRWRKEGVFWTLAFGAGLAGAIGHLLNPGFVVLSKEWGVSVDTVAATNNTLILTLGCFMLIQAPLAIKFGRRPVYLLGATLFFTCSIWSAVSQGLDSFTGSRALQGFGMAPFEALVTATIADIFFVHQRGLRTAIWSFAILAGINIAPIVNGSLLQSSRLGWRFCFWFITAMFGVLLLGIVFFVPETVYDRDAKYDTDIAVRPVDVPAERSSEEGGDKSVEGQDTKASLKEKEIQMDEYPINIEISHQGQTIFTRQYLPWSGYIAKESMLGVFLRPFRFLLSPIILYGICVYGFTVIWLDVINVIVATVFSLPPYHFDGSQVGLVSIGPFVGSIFAAAVSGPLSDWVTTEFARRNNGIYEPEARLFLVIPMLILQVCGYLGWAIMAPRGVHWIGPVLMYTLINVGLSIGNTGVVAYIIDVHRKNSPECFALINFVKDVILYGFIRFANSWVSDVGVLKTFGTLAGLSAFCILTTVPMYIYGKRARSFIARHPRIFLV